MQVGGPRAIWDLGQVKAELEEALDELPGARGGRRRRLLRRIRLLLLWVDEILSNEEGAQAEAAAQPGSAARSPLSSAVVRFLVREAAARSFLGRSYPGLPTILLLRGPAKGSET